VTLPIEQSVFRKRIPLQTHTRAMAITTLPKERNAIGCISQKTPRSFRSFPDGSRLDLVYAHPLCIRPKVYSNAATIAATVLTWFHIVHRRR
jgi:hypothetical protein